MENFDCNSMASLVASIDRISQPTMNITKGIISRAEALAKAPAYVSFLENMMGPSFDTVMEAFEALRVGQSVVTFLRSEKKFVLAKVSSVKPNPHPEADGPIVRVSNGEYTWRVDGSGFAYPVS